MEFKILGTGSATPLADRNPSGFIVTIENTLLLIDCGEGTQSRLLQYKVKVNRIKYVFISHLHGDHYFGLIGLLSSFGLNNRKDPLTIFGPKGLDEIITIQLKYSGSVLPFELNFIQTQQDSLQEILKTENISVSSFPMQHRVDTTGFIVEKTHSKRKIRVDKLPENFPIAYYKLLENGKDVQDELTGKIFLNSEYTHDGSPTKKIAYCSDTIFDENLVEFVKNADLLYHEATFDQNLAERAAETFHSTAGQAATIALKANVKKLIIGHFSSRYKTLIPLLMEAQAIFDKTILAKEGENYII